MKELLEQFALAEQRVYEASKERNELRCRIMELCPVKVGQVIKYKDYTVEVETASFFILYLSDSAPGIFMWQITGHRKTRGRPYVTINLTENQTVEII